MTTDWTHYVEVGAMVWAGALAIWVAWASRDRSRPYDWELDGECTPRETHVKVMS